MQKLRFYGSRPLLSVIFILVSIIITELFVKYVVLEILNDHDTLFDLMVQTVFLVPMLYFLVCKRISHYIKELIETKSQLEEINSKLAKSRDFYLSLFDEFPTMIWRSGTDGECNYFNKEWLGFTGHKFGEQIELGWTSGIYLDDLDYCVQLYLDSFKDRKPFTMEFRMLRYNGEYRWIAGNGRAFDDIDGNFAGYMCSFSDITVRKQLEEKAWHQAFHDMLTGLPNRQLFTEILDVSLAHHSRNSKMLGLMFIDLDQFKAINDTYGHHIGDKVLIEFAKNLKKCIRGEDVAARLGGDEFLILLPEIRKKKSAIAVADRILNSSREPLIIGDISINISPSIGISIFPLDGETVDTLIKSADSAMYKAKECKNCYRFACEI